MENNAIIPKEEKSEGNHPQEGVQSTEEVHTTTIPHITSVTPAVISQIEKLTTPTSDTTKNMFYCNEEFHSSMSRSNSLTNNGSDSTNSSAYNPSQSSFVNSTSLDFSKLSAAKVVGTNPAVNPTPFQNHSSTESIPLMGTKTQKPLKYTLSKVAMSGYEGDLNHLSRQYQPHQNLSPTIFSNEAVHKIMKSVLPSYADIEPDCIVVMQTLITEFLSYLLAERELIEDSEKCDFNASIIKALYSLGMTENAASIELLQSRLTQIEKESLSSTSSTSSKPSSKLSYEITNTRDIAQIFLKLCSQTKSTPAPSEEKQTYAFSSPVSNSKTAANTTIPELESFLPADSVHEKSSSTSHLPKLSLGSKSDHSSSVSPFSASSTTNLSSIHSENLIFGSKSDGKGLLSSGLLSSSTPFSFTSETAANAPHEKNETTQGPVSSFSQPNHASSTELPQNVSTNVVYTPQTSKEEHSESLKRVEESTEVSKSVKLE